jgi:hypothetical protein
LTGRRAEGSGGFGRQAPGNRTLRHDDIGRRIAVDAAKIAQMRGAGVGGFGALGFGFGRASARAAIAHGFAPGGVLKITAARAVCSCYVLIFPENRQAIFLKFIIAFVLKSRIVEG